SRAGPRRSPTRSRGQRFRRARPGSACRNVWENCSTCAEGGPLRGRCVCFGETSSGAGVAESVGLRCAGAAQPFGSPAGGTPLVVASPDRATTRGGLPLDCVARLRRNPLQANATQTGSKLAKARRQHRFLAAPGRHVGSAPRVPGTRPVAVLIFY